MQGRYARREMISGLFLWNPRTETLMVRHPIGPWLEGLGEVVALPSREIVCPFQADGGCSLQPGAVLEARFLRRN